MDKAVGTAGWLEEEARGAMPMLAIGAILDEEGVDATVDAVAAEFDALREPAS